MPVLNQSWSVTRKSVGSKRRVSNSMSPGITSIFVDPALAGMIGQRDLHHLEVTVAELVGGEERAVGPAEGDPGDRRLRLQLRQEDELALVGLAGVEHVLQEQRSDGGVGGARFVDDRRHFLANGGDDLLVDGAGELPADRFRRAPPQQARCGGGEQDRRQHQRRDRKTDADRQLRAVGRDRGRSNALRRGTAFMLASAGDRRCVDDDTRGSSALLHAAVSFGANMCAAFQPPMPIGYGLHSDKALELPAAPAYLSHADSTVCAHRSDVTDS